MPHSSGGGSHSGGSHSSSSSSYSSSSSSSSSNATRTQNTYFKGAHKYVTYINGAPHYVYSTSRTLNQPASKWRFLLILFYLPFFIGAFTVLKDSIVNPRRLPLKYDTQIIIEDNINAVEAEDVLKNSLESFLDKTGISVALLTENNAAWKNYYMSMSTYAYDMYVQRFPDESHWLIVYTTDKNGDFEDWYFEGMQGNNTDPILTTDITNIFNNSMTKYLMQGYSVDRSLIKALADIEAEGLFKVHVSKETLFVALIIGGFAALHMSFLLRDPNKKYRNYIPCSETAVKEEHCEYCGSAYWPGTILECPKCGAPLQTSNQ